VGLAFGAAGHELDLDALVRRADTAMYEVKNHGRNGCAVYVPTPADEVEIVSLDTSRAVSPLP
jgi:hypothetical protein